MLNPAAPPAPAPALPASLAAPLRSLDLAGLVHDVVGVDASLEAIDMARKSAVERTVANADFVVADIHDLPFADSSFDVVYGHQVLQHLSDPVAALEEAYRVLRPGGLVAVRDADYGTMVHTPHDPHIDRWLDLYHRLAAHNGAEPDAGRHLTNWVSLAGFKDLATTTSTWTYATPESASAWCDLWVSRLTEARMGRDLRTVGLADDASIDEMVAGWSAWAASEQPFFAFLHGEVIGSRPPEPS